MKQASHKRTNIVSSHLYEILGVVKFIERNFLNERKMMVAKVSGEGVMESHMISTGFQFEKM